MNRPDRSASGHSKVDHIWSIGDTTDIPISKSGSVAHYEATVVAAEITAALKGEAPPRHVYDGKVWGAHFTSRGLELPRVLVRQAS